MKEEGRNKMICFHDPEKEYGFLSNWYMSDFIEDGRLYTSVEQYLMYGKALVFKDEDMQQAILNTHDVAEIKKYGRQVKGYNETLWNGLRQLVLYRGLWLKFSQNEELKQKLIDTGNDMLVECAITDKIFACGISMKDPMRLDMSKWPGKNLLGFALMDLREQLKK